MTSLPWWPNGCTAWREWAIAGSAVGVGRSVIGLAGACLLLAACPAAAPEANGPGQDQVAHLPPQEAMDLNREGKVLYRDGHFAEARAKYELAKKSGP